MGVKMTKKIIYLDNAATTPVDPRIAKVVNEAMLKGYGNASSMHTLGTKARVAVENSRRLIASYLKVLPEEIVFTSGGTESNNLAIQGIAYANKNKGNHIITSKIEHPSVIEVCESLEKKGFKVTYVGVDNQGLIKPEDVEKAITNETILVSIMHVNNEIGTIQPIAEIARICRSKGVLFHTDAVQSFGKLEMDASKFDLLSASGHKVNAPKGIGILYIKKGIKLVPIVYGGGQERKIRSGTENVPGIAAMGKAVEIIGENLNKSGDLEKLREIMIERLLKIEGTRLNGSRTRRIPNNINISFRNVEGESLVLLLDDCGIATSTGSACSSHSLEPSHVLAAIGLDDIDAHSSLRITLGYQNTKQELDYAAFEIEKAVNRLRKISSQINLGGKNETKKG
jgi:cysteine desulfurase